LGDIQKGLVLFGFVVVRRVFFKVVSLMAMGRILRFGFDNVSNRLNGAKESRKKSWVMQDRNQKPLS
jgi:hypothetical protein